MSENVNIFIYIFHTCNISNFPFVSPMCEICLNLFSVNFYTVKDKNLHVFYSSFQFSCSAFTLTLVVDIPVGLNIFYMMLL